MGSITQDMKFRQSLLKYAQKHGVTQTAIKYRKTRQYVYFWRRRWDGTVQSLSERSHRPHSHPNQHTEAELKLIRDMRLKNMHYGLVFLWIKLRKKHYQRSITGLYRVLVREGLMATKPSNPKKYRPKPYEQMQYPGQRVQVDVKHVPLKCSTTGERYYQYTAIDEYSRYRVLGAFKEQSTYSSAQFVDEIIAKFPFPIECIQTDNGPEFTNRFNGKGSITLFEKTLQALGIKHKLIRPYTPRHNGKVERSHRKDNEYFYAVKSFFSFDDFMQQLQKHARWYNNFPMCPLGFKSPKEILGNFCFV